MTTTNIVRKVLKEAGFQQYQDGGVGKCGVGLSGGDFQVKEEGKVQYYGARNHLRRTVKTGRVIVISKFGNKLDAYKEALAAAGITATKEARTNYSLNWEKNEALIIA